MVFGSNLSIVQIRQDFSKHLVNVLQTGSSNLTPADTNEEAANSPALSSRQSVAVSAPALANQSQQGCSGWSPKFRCEDNDQGGGETPPSLLLGERRPGRTNKALRNKKLSPRF